MSSLTPALSALLALGLAGSCKKSSAGDDGRIPASGEQAPAQEPATTAPENNYQLEGSGPELYERILVPPLFAPWADDLIARAALEKGQRVLDVATGTGVVARKAASQVGDTGAVTGLDINPGMLEVARATADGADVEWVEGDALKLPFAAGTFDVVLCQQGLQFFPDRAAAVSEMHRVLKPGGRVLISVWRRTDHNPYAEAFARVVGERVSPAARAESESPFAWDRPEELESMMRAAGLENIEVEAKVLTMQEDDLAAFVVNDLLAYPTLGKTLAGWEDATKDELVAAILGELEESRRGDGWEIEWSAQVASASKPE